MNNLGTSWKQQFYQVFQQFQRNLIEQKKEFLSYKMRHCLDDTTGIMREPQMQKEIQQIPRPQPISR